MQKYFNFFQKTCDQRRLNRTYGVKGRVDLSAGGWWLHEFQNTDTGGRFAMIAFNARRGLMRWSAFFSLCFWRLRLKINRIGA